MKMTLTQNTMRNFLVVAIYLFKPIDRPDSTSSKTFASGTKGMGFKLWVDQSSTRCQRFATCCKHEV